VNDHKRKVLFLATIVISLLVLAAPARGAEWFGVSVGTGGFSLSFGSSNWAVYGSSWSNPGWAVDYHVALSGYGEWVWVDGLGQCWRPWVTTGWRPYTHGRWVWTSYGWTWVAYEPWGYFPHHYGNWAFSVHGWVWSPGYHYRSANVAWVHAGAYVGWYPRPPVGWSHASRGFHHGYNKGYRNGHRDGYHVGYDDGYWNGWNDARYATYSRWGQLGADDLSRHAVSANTVRSSAPSVSVRVAASAPTRSSMDRRGIDLPQRTMERRTALVGGREITVARPQGVEGSVRSNAGRTVERALSREARETVVTRTTEEQRNLRSTKNNIHRATQSAAAEQINRSSTPDRATRKGRTGSVSAQETASKPSRRVNSGTSPSRERVDDKNGSQSSREPEQVRRQTPDRQEKTRVRPTETNAGKTRASSESRRRSDVQSNRSPQPSRSETTSHTARSGAKTSPRSTTKKQREEDPPNTERSTRQRKTDRAAPSKSKERSARERTRGSRQ